MQPRNRKGVNGERYRDDGHGHRAKPLQPGQQIDKLTIVAYAGKKPRVGLLYLCRCTCGAEIVRPGAVLRYGVKQKRAQSCSKCARLKGPANSLWKGGRYVDPRGYVWVVEREHPNANQRGYVMEHWLVMSKTLGRPIRQGETVHHRNGRKGDNRPQNLELWSKSHHPGQRISDQIAWAVELLRTYAPEKLVE